MFSETKFYYKKAEDQPTEEDITATNDDGWTTWKSKHARKKRRQEKPTENGTRSDKKKPEKAEAAQENGEEHNEAIKKDKKKRAKTEKKKKADVSSDKANVATDSLVDTLSRTFTSVNPQSIEELIVEMGLTSFDPDNAPLRARILNALIEKQQRLVIAPAESESDHDESDEKAHIEPEQVTSSDPMEEEKLQTEEEAQAEETVHEDEEAKESGTKKSKKKRRPKKKSTETGDEPKEQGKKKQAAQKGKQKKQGRTEFDEEQESDEKQERTKKDVLLNELNSFDPSSQLSISQLMKWNNEMKTNWNEFASMFDELKGLELLIDKWIYTPDFRNIVCERPFVDFLSWFLPGDREYHEFVMAQIMEICRCLDTLGSDKRKAMQDVMSNHCKQLLQVLTIRGYAANPSAIASIATANSSTSKLHHLLLPKPSSLFPTPSVKDPLSGKIRDLDSCCDGLSSGYEALQQQHNRVEQMKPTSNDSFRKVYAMLKNDVNSRMNSLVTERRKVQNELQMIEHERKSIETNMSRSVSPMQTELNKVSVDLRTLSAQQKEYEKKLNEVNILLEQLHAKHKQLNDRIHEVKVQYGPKEEKLHYEHQNCSFQSVALEKEHKCYERISELADESWRKLEEWSQTFMEKYHGESEVCENQFIDQCVTYIYSMLDAKTFLLNRVEHLKQMVSDARQYQARTKQLYGDTLILKSLNFNADGEPHIAFDMQVLEWIEKQLKQVIVKCRETVRKSSYQRFVLQLNAQLSNNGYDTTFLKPFVDEVTKETMYGASNPSGVVPTSLPTATGTMSSSANISHVHPHVNAMHAGGNSSINTSSTHSPASARVHSYGVPIPSATGTNPTLVTIFPSTAVGLNNVNVSANNPSSLKPNVPTSSNFNVNPNANLNPNSNANVVVNRKLPVIVSPNQIDSSSHQPQPTQIPVFSKKTGPVIPKMPTVAKQTQTIPITSTSTAPVPQNDATAAQRLKNSQRRPPMLSGSSHQ